MTKVQNPIIGRSRGSAGGMTFSKNFDKNVMRAKAFEVKNPKTAAQTTQRDFFKQVQEITATVTDEELRSLFGDMPKAMSRRNALSKQIAAAYSVEDNVKSVDFSKLQAIGNGEKVSTPIGVITDGLVEFSTAPAAEQFGTNTTNDTNVIFVVFDTSNNGIVISNSQMYIEDVCQEAISIETYVGSVTGYAYFTCASDGACVSEQAFGTFTMKTRAVKTNANAQSDTPRPGDVVIVEALTQGSQTTLNFNNYNMNNLQPGNLIEKVGDENVILVNSDRWEESEENIYVAPLTETISDPTKVYLEIMQSGSLVEAVPFAVRVE